jgi:hypothetical protein
MVLTELEKEKLRLEIIKLKFEIYNIKNKIYDDFKDTPKGVSEAEEVIDKLLDTEF